MLLAPGAFGAVTVPRAVPVPRRVPAVGRAVPRTVPSAVPGAVPRTVPARRDTARTRQLAGRWLLAVVGAAAVGALAVQLRDADLGATLASVHPGRLGLGLGWFALSVLAAAYTVTGFSALRLRLAPTLLAQLAIGGLRLVAPSALSTPAVLMRYLVRSGAPVADAATTVGAGQAAQLLATGVVVAGLGVASGNGWPAPPSGRVALAVLGAVLLLALAGRVVVRRSERVRAGVRAAGRSQAVLAAHARRRPGRVATGLLASVALTLTHVLAFAACVAAVGGKVPLLALAAVYLGAATAGSLVPTPGGIGPVEAALVAGLGAAGLALPVATAAALLSRLVSVWLPAVPGVVALAVLRRRGLL